MTKGKKVGSLEDLAKVWLQTERKPKREHRASEQPTGNSQETSCEVDTPLNEGQNSALKKESDSAIELAIAGGVPKGLRRHSKEEIQQMVRYGVLEEKIEYLRSSEQSIQQSLEHKLGQLEEHEQRCEAVFLERESLLQQCALLKQDIKALQSDKQGFSEGIDKLVATTEQLEKAKNKLEEKLEASKDKRAWLKKGLCELQKQKTEITRLEEELSRLTNRKYPFQHLERTVKKLRDSEREDKKRQKLLDIREAQLLERRKELTLETRRVKRRVTTLETELTTVSERAELTNILGSAIDTAGNNLAIFSPCVVLVGDGPFSRDDLKKLYRKYGVVVVPPNTEGVDKMVVGRHGWSEEELEKQIAAQEGQQLRVYSQEMALVSILMRNDMMERPDVELMRAYAATHPALQFLSKGELNWPSFRPGLLPQDFNPFEWGTKVEQSPLVELGYHVGITRGETPQARRKILQQAYLDELPFVESDEYMDDWGQPKTRRRLWRMSNHISWLARNFRKLPSHHVAVYDWSEDLTFLKKSYYRPWMRFKWPSAKVPK